MRTVCTAKGGIVRVCSPREGGVCLEWTRCPKRSEVLLGVGGGGGVASVIRCQMADMQCMAGLKLCSVSVRTHFECILFVRPREYFRSHHVLRGGRAYAVGS